MVGSSSFRGVGVVSRSKLARTALAVVLAFATGSGLIGTKTASAARYSSIVIDAASGTVLSEYNADAQTYPASLTKMMTLYLTFDALERKVLAAEQSLPVSVHAADQEPTKIDLVAGEEVTVRNLILGLVTQSANDAAVVLAEGLAGSEPAFAARMTDTAHALGMDGTNFANASGLPNPRQHTTARDIAILARHLYIDFPKEYAFFATEDFTFHGVTYSNHNHLMSSFAGMDGIKTGFIRASGFNLAASAVRDNRRLIGVVMGGLSAHARDEKMASLLNAGFEGRTLPEVQLASASVVPESGRAATRSSVLHKLAHHAAHTLEALSPIGSAEAAAPAHHAADNWSIQVGVFKDQDAAARAGAAAIAHLPGGQGKPVIVAAPHGHKGNYQARIVNLTEKQAQGACRTLHRGHHSCMIVAPSVQVAAR